MQFILIAVVIVLGAGAAWLLTSSDDATLATETESEVVAQADTDASLRGSETEDQMEVESGDDGDNLYADGTYTQTGTYISPAGQETITISLTLEDDVVTDASFEGHATNPGSVQNQAKFAGGFEEAVVGKALDEIALTVVNGSSLTPNGFMDAAAKIKAEAAS